MARDGWDATGRKEGQKTSMRESGDGGDGGHGEGDVSV